MNDVSTGADVLTYDGGAIKALGNGRVQGYLVLFSGPDSPDLQGEYFTKETDFGIDSGDVRPIYYRHGFHPLIKSERIGKATLTIDDVGVFVDGEIDLRNKYIRALYTRAEEKKDDPFLGWSSGALSHLVQKKSADNGMKELVVWPIGEATVTPAPVEPRTSVMTVKEFVEANDLDLEQFVKSIEEPKEEVKEEEPVSLDGLPALKALCEALSPAVSITRLEHSQIADAAVKELLTHNKVFVDAFKHYRVRLDQHVEFRKERNRKPMSDSQSQSIKSWKEGLSDVRLGIQSIETDLEGTLKRTETALAEADAAEQHAKFLMQQLDSLIAKE